MSKNVNEILYGVDLFGDTIKPETRGVLRSKFIMPPFSILNARDGLWQRRKKQWLTVGIKSELGRDDSLSLAQGLNKYDYRKSYTGTSVFCPVLTELMYTWFCPSGGLVIDPFAGGSVRGVVASLLGFRYWGNDLSERQIMSNIIQGNDICDVDIMPSWVHGDSLYMMDNAPMADFIFSCPPYGNLEVYSNDYRDLSNMVYDDFIYNFTEIIKKTSKRLKNNRFACIVVSDFRDKQGDYYNFTGDTITAFESCGLSYYNRAIYLENGLNTAAMRASKQFNAKRKLVKVHQDVIIFCKGDAKTATLAITKD